MTLEEKCRLSYYQPVAEIDSEHGVFLVRHTESGNFFVRKTLINYSRPVFESLMRDPAFGMPALADVFEEDGVLTVIEEYIPGKTLKQYLDETGPLDSRTARSLMLQLCDIVAGLHRRTPAIVHRDIKPSNIMVLSDGSIRLLDIDAARFHSPEKSSDTVLLGTAGFAAPEQYGFAASSPLADVYALGVVFNVMLTGELPGEKKSRGINARIISRCTRLEPSERFQSVQALKRSLIFKGLDVGLFMKNPSWLRYLPPGLSSGRPLLMLFSLLIYVIIALLGEYTPADQVKPGYELLNKLIIPLEMYSIILLSFNYLGVLDRLPLIKRTRGLPRFLLILAADTLIFVSFALINDAICV